MLHATTRNNNFWISEFIFLTGFRGSWWFPGKGGVFRILQIRLENNTSFPKMVWVGMVAMNICIYAHFQS